MKQVCLVGLHNYTAIAPAPCHLVTPKPSPHRCRDCDPLVPSGSQEHLRIPPGPLSNKGNREERVWAQGECPTPAPELGIL